MASQSTTNAELDMLVAVRTGTVDERSLMWCRSGPPTSRQPSREQEQELLPVLLNKGITRGTPRMKSSAPNKNTQAHILQRSLSTELRILW